ncbi:hypothetical protein FJV83_26510 [Mesorhizobium sp. WSM4307]|uniref:hypothetical protein n=1 Tax=unclassified Mesorhizobium TaxID=325217 RepID=UPI000BB0A08C|nr:MULTISPECIES: hypothetical protein [unclassified Mesorhizobium]PBB25623.1 hypothetical protein CK232_14875 [Mesorhizobium sp. WSM4304]PBB72079.1 hypothetical protein CK227_28330 [Mesorhizobium sp. WSM4308]PBC24910.1 hypothetical protein CK226_03505 [Mesorhizobium sp. WSM4311]TRC74567.1 hypothetical protein FJV81_21010 [Mesorhizobium sp. WSM4315]TRC80457.1 hypothetical protein FJV83_26510 [Mesorhizobium sp. WSM4307]
MFEGRLRLFLVWLCAALFLLPVSLAAGQEKDGVSDLKLPGISSYATPKSEAPLALGGGGAITLSAQLTDKGTDITRGLVWRVFKPEAVNGKLPMVASAHGGSAVFQLEPGSYLVHASYGRAGATKRITVGKEAKRESLVLDAGGLKLDAVLSGGVRIPPKKLRFSIYEGTAEANGDRALIIPDVEPNSVVRLNAGIYHVVSTYGAVNAVIRSDIRVEAGKLTEATVEHHAAEITMKLVREAGGEAIADTSWSLLNESGDPIKETVGAFASMVLAEGDYTIIAKNRDRIYQKDFTVVAGQNQEIEVLATEAAAMDPEEGAD